MSMGRTVLMVLAMAGLSGMTEAWSQAYPTKSVRLVVTFPPGGGADVLGRYVAKELSARWGQSVVVDNRGGGDGAIGAAFAARTPADGYTLLMVLSTHAVLPSMKTTLDYDIVHDFVPIVRMTEAPNIVVAHPSFPATTIREYLAYARANPGKINMAATGAGSIQHLAGAWLHSVTNTRVTFVQYKGTSPLNVDLVSGRVDVNASPFVNVMPLVKAGKLKILGILSDEASPLIPGAQVAAEQGATGYSYSSWLGVIAPRATPVAIVNKLSASFAQIARQPDIVKHLEDNAQVPVGNTPEEFRKVIAADIARWGAIVRSANIVVED